VTKKFPLHPPAARSMYAGLYVAVAIILFGLHEVLLSDGFGLIEPDLLTDELRLQIWPALFIAGVLKAAVWLVVIVIAAFLYGFLPMDLRKKTKARG